MLIKDKFRFYPLNTDIHISFFLLTFILLLYIELEKNNDFIFPATYGKNKKCKPFFFFFKETSFVRITHSRKIINV